MSESGVYVGNDFKVTRPRLNLALETVSQPPASINVSVRSSVMPETVSLKPIASSKTETPLRKQLSDWIHGHSVIVFALLVLAIGIALIELGSHYILTEELNAQPIPKSPALSASSLTGLNIGVSASQLASTVQSVTSQPASLNLGSQTVAISPSTIKSWLNITPSADKTKDNIHINAALISSSLLSLANSYVRSPVNQVVVTRSDGTSETAVFGQDGSQLTDPNSIAPQATTIAKNLFDNKGFQVDTTLATLPFQTVTPAAFSKLIVVDLNSKRMYLYQNGQLVNTFLVSAGKPSTPTPVGEFHIWEKLTLQTMVGPGYVQPNVPWINYFNHSGDAIHGVYWRPASVFGNVNTSHGCVGVPVNEAQWIYNWAPIGTTVITTPN